MYRMCWKGNGLPRLAWIKGLAKLIDTQGIIDGALAIPSAIAGIFILCCMAFQVFCILSMPFAAWTCAALARERRVSAWRYALAGAACSALLLVPLRLLKQRMCKEKISSEEIRDILGILNSVWLIWIGSNCMATIGLMIVVADVTFPPEEWSWSYLLSQYFFWLSNGFVILLSMLAWAYFRRNVLVRFAVDGEISGNSEANELPFRLYITPFAFASASIIFSPFMLFMLHWFLIAGSLIYYGLHKLL